MERLKLVGWVLLAGLVSLIFSSVILIGLSYLVEYFKAINSLEPRLFFESFLAPILVLFIGGWAWLSGKFLSKDKPQSWGLKAVYLYIAVSLLPYLFSFFVGSSS